MLAARDNSSVRLNRTAALRLLPALLAGAYLLTLALESGRLPWLGLFTLLPLFRAIQTLSPLSAGLCGGFWGLSVLCFGTLGSNPAISLSAGSLALLLLVPGCYAAIGAWVTRLTRFSPVVLGAGWLLVELGLSPLGLAGGLLALSDETLVLGATARVFGFVVVAFLAAFLSAWLLETVSRLRLRIVLAPLAAGLDEAGLVLWHVVCARVPTRVLCLARPRGPPAADV